MTKPTAPDTTTTAAPTTKKAFDLSRNSIYVADPDELCIIGGQILPEDERGPLDTDHAEGEHDLWDVRLLNAITPESVANIDAHGVMEPVIIAKDKDTGLPVIVDGRGRVRRARRANVLRRGRGEPLISIDCKVLRSSGTRLLTAMISLNEVRDADGPAAKLQKAKLLLERGVSPEDAAITFGMTPAYFAALLAYDDAAGADVKAAVATGDMSLSAGAEIVRATKDPVQQAAAVQIAKAGAKAAGKKTATVKEASNAARVATGKAAVDTGAGLVPTRRELATVAKILVDHTEAAADARILIDDEKDESGIEVTQAHVVDAYFIGVEAMLDVVLGKGGDKTLLDLVAKARRKLAAG